MYDFFNTLMYIFDYPIEGLFFMGSIIFALICSVRVKTTFSKYNLVRAQNGISAQQVARAILDSNGLYNVEITRCAGNLTDHYDPRSKTLALSDTVINSPSVAAIGVAAHECGHAIQDAKSYGPMRVRQAIVPAVQLCSKSWMFVLLIGCLISSFIVVQIAIVFLAMVVLFQLVTLPVEFDASKRAMDTLANDHLLYGNELAGARKVLSAAAMTYVAGLLTSVAQLVRVLANTSRRKR